MTKAVSMTEAERGLFSGPVLCPVENQNCHAWNSAWKSVRCDDCPLVQSPTPTMRNEE